MTRTDLVLAIDQGTSSTKALLIDETGSVVGRASVPVRCTYPRPGWVEQSPVQIFETIRVAVAEVMAGIDPARVAAVGFSTQRESLMLWHAHGNQPVGPLISWQDQRTADFCDELVAGGSGELVQRQSGLPLDPMFSATKARWLLDVHDPSRMRSRSGSLRLGTVDSWIMAQFTDAHVIEIGNASRTQLLSIAQADWDEQLLDLFGVPRSVLGRILPSTGPFPSVRDLAPLLDGTPVSAVLGDSHAALFAHAGWEPGVVKATYGTGSSVMALCPPGSSSSTTRSDGLCSTIAWDLGDGPAYAVEGNIRSSGATLSWLARLVGSTTAALAALAADAHSDGVHLVPAFSGLGAPWWDRNAAGLVSGLSLGTELPQLARAALESVVLQVGDVVDRIDRRIGPVTMLLADGGASVNPVLMQLQADLSGRTVARAEQADLSPLGAGHLAGLSVGIWDQRSIGRLPRERTVFQPTGPEQLRLDRVAGWHAAVARSRWTSAPQSGDD